MAKGKSKPEGGVSKLGAMRQVIQKLGVDAANSDIQASLKSDFGVTLSTGMFSNYKSAVIKKLRGGKRGRKRGRKPATVPASNGTAKASPGSISVEEIAAVKKLVDQLGAEKVEQLARVLAK